MGRTVGWALASAVFLAAGGGCSGGGTPAAPPQGGAFRAIEQEVFAPRCVRAGCHGGDHPAGNLDLEIGRAYDSLVGVAAERRPGRLRVDPGNPEGSYLVERLTPGGDTPRMPVGGKPLSEAELEAVRTWIRDGAKR